MQSPSYFNNIQRRASERWDQLENDPELAGTWHQLFRQVQSPRHVVSELLQNADDAGAKSASVRIEDNTFIFEHDGGDFDHEQFASLCRFGFSNKRNLHTIGFRGVGFKSTFSLGDSVEVHTPTLAVCFKKKRFTEPVWLPDARPVQRTVIRVRIADRNRASQLQKNFEEWSQSPASLLFFNSLKELTIEGQVIKRQPLGKGPVVDSSWVKLVGTDAQKLLVVQSEAVRFPDEAAEEIRSERGVVAEDLLLPPCRVEIVLGSSETKRLFVVLPTGAELNLPFSCDAPFIQDPARFAIKDPATSPTNRWLLERAGKLAGKAILQWLGNTDLSLKDRAAAYDLLKGAIQFPAGLDGTCSQIIMETMLTMQALMKWGELFPAIKSATANLQMLSVDVAQLSPFVAIRNLGEAVEFRVTRIVESSGKKEPREWLNELADGLCRAKFSNDEDTRRVRAAANRLRQTTWRAFTHLDVTPYVEGAPAGEPFTPKALWQDVNLYVAGQSTVRLYKELADELARPFSHPQVSDAISACIDRTPEFVAEYLEAHLELDAQPELPPAQPIAPSSETESGKPEEPGQDASESTDVETPAPNGEEAAPAEVLPFG